jgi:hypothetical protein
MRGSMLLVVVVAVAGAVALPGCKGDTKGSLGEKTGNIVNDERLLREASEAVNRVVANAGDCDAVKGALPEANKVLSDTLGKLRTPAGRATIEALRARVNAAVQMCQ